jgi:hypothetical protein
MHGRFSPADAHTGADLHVNYIYLLSPSCSQPTFWSSQIMVITPTKQQFLVYFTSEVLTGSKRFYSKMEKIYYAVIMSAHKLRHYFEVHTIKVLTNQQLNDIFGNTDNSGRISKWAVELSEHVVDFEKRSSKKSHILADFVAEWTEPGFEVEGQVPKSAWFVSCDGSWGIAGARAASILTSPSGVKLRYAARLLFNSEGEKCTNNIEKYEAILLGCQKLRASGDQRCTLYIDSMVVAGQIEKEGPEMLPLKNTLL